MTDADTTLVEAKNFAWEFCRSCLRSEPVLVVGSGASAAYTLPTMSQLADTIVCEIEKNYLPNTHQECWTRFKTILDRDGLEQAIDQSDIWRNESLYMAIRRVTWNCVAARDNVALRTLLQDPSALALSNLFRHLLSSHNTVVRVITTNYDRLAEYAAGAAGYCCRTGFQPGYIGDWRSDRPSLAYFAGARPYPEKTVEIWKVHGSLDWFALPHDRYAQVPLLDAIPNGIKPLIVPPSLRKHADTQEDPFRTIIRGADSVLRQASAFLCIGYGFRDAHIQIKLIERVRKDRKPLVVLARTFTPQLKALLSNSQNISFVAFERDGDLGTRTYSSRFPAGILLEGVNVWDLRHFVTDIIGD